MELAKYLARVDLSEGILGDAFLLVAGRHDRNPEIHSQSNNLAAWSQAHRERLAPYLRKYGADQSENEPARRLREALFLGSGQGGPGLLADLQDLALLTTQVLLQWTAIHQAAIALFDKEFEQLSEECCEQTDRQLSWLKTHIQTAAGQALTVPANAGPPLGVPLPKRHTPSRLPAPAPKPQR